MEIEIKINGDIVTYEGSFEALCENNWSEIVRDLMENNYSNEKK